MQLPGAPLLRSNVSGFPAVASLLLEGLDVRLEIVGFLVLYRLVRAVHGHAGVPVLNHRFHLADLGGPATSDETCSAPARWIRTMTLIIATAVQAREPQTCALPLRLVWQAERRFFGMASKPGWRQRADAATHSFLVREVARSKEATPADKAVVSES